MSQEYSEAAVVEEVTAAVVADEVEVAAEPTEEETYKLNSFTPQEAAQQLGGVAADWTGKRLRRFIRDGSCPARKIGGRWFVTVEDLETLLSTLEAKEAAKAAKVAAEAKAAEVVEAAVVEVAVEVDPLN